MKKTTLVWIFAFIAILSTVSAQPPFVQQGEFTTGFEIRIPPFGYIPQAQDYEFHFHVFNITNGIHIHPNSSDYEVDCFLHIYNSSGNHIVETRITEFDQPFDWEYTIVASDIANTGVYSYIVQCNATDLLGGFNSAEFIVTSDGLEKSTSASFFLAAIILLPMILGLFFLIGAATLTSPDHTAIRIVLFLLSVPTFFVSLHIGMINVIRFYDFGILEDYIGTTVYWTGWVFAVLIIYFLLYAFYKGIALSAQEKKERLEY